MCLQCLTNAETIATFPSVEGRRYYIMRAVDGHRDWPQGYYGLVHCNDPDAIWSNQPSKEPDLPDEALEGSQELKAWEDWWDNAHAPVRNALNAMNFAQSVDFISYMVKAYPDREITDQFAVDKILEMQMEALNAKP